ncbi:PQQ-dependent sugar dehydrogenase [Aneurinibacillus sp. Ricciae_BoGa-3]|uniref:PQQ-dependent sugar dehydrogenase n=1 Tax=Aneurinibacillus sp. Ricciae_BoGa-3 TaxID=3022697 RepID=UPI0023410075|nr:PQQ-dependent sugar dehydrogenase [Aneurinibacillus sp. Ricciae_BoGa-3]WCK56307.1 PQQ-dependent sugar dehydrogenase [Aneurinibacillus sp. Ricciae_BoGa-3]
MSAYIPSGMIEKEYTLEVVNYKLYERLQQINPYSELKNFALELGRKQEQQLSLLQRFASIHSTFPKEIPKYFEVYKSFSSIADELYDREYQLLQEYESYAYYFLSADVKNDLLLQALIDTKMQQVNMLIDIKKYMSAISKHHDQNIAQATVPFELEEGYQLEKVVANLTFPTSLTVDDQGFWYIAESGFAYGTPPGEGRVLRVGNNGALTEIAGGFKGPLTGLTWHQGYFYTAEGNRGGGDRDGGKITKFSLDGRRKVIVSNLVSCGDHFTGDIKVGPNNKLYFTVGTATNSAVVGADNTEWRKLHPNFHDTSARNFVLNGTNFISPRIIEHDQNINITGAYKPFGVPSFDGETVKGNLFANGVIYSCDLDGNDLRIIADGFRNPFGMRFSPFNGKLYITDNGADERGSRPINRDWDNFWEITINGWYGWPDFFSGLPCILPHFHVADEPQPTFLIKKHPPLACQPMARFARHTSSNKFDFSRNPVFGHVREVFVAQLEGFKVVRLNTETGQIRDFLVNPMAESNTHGPIRPLQAKFSPDGTALYVVDFGRLSNPQPHTGALWKITKK